MLARRKKVVGADRHRGIALMLVIMVMAIAAILGYAMLASSAVQATASSNDISVAVAQAEAESGIHLAMYYLLNPRKVPSLTNAHWPGASNITFSSPTAGSTMQGSVTVSVSDPVAGVYTVTSVGSSGAGSSGETVTRTITAQVKVLTAFLINQAAAFNSDVTVNSGMVINGSPTSLVTTGSLNLNGGNVNGDIYAASILPYGSPMPAPNISAAPAAGTIQDFSAPYTYHGQLYSPTAITLPLPSSLGPTAGNPLGIYYYTGTLTVTSPLSIIGTLSVNGALINQSNISVNAAVSDSPPLLVVAQALKMNGAGKRLNINGVACLGTLTGQANSGATNISINGALLITATSNPIDPSYTGNMTVNFNPAIAKAPTLSSSNQSPTSVRIVGWSE